MESHFKYTKIKQSFTEKLPYPETQLQKLLKQADGLLEEINSINNRLRKEQEQTYWINKQLNKIGE